MCLPFDYESIRGILYHSKKVYTYRPDRQKIPPI